MAINNYPYTNLQDLNLDWILEVITKIKNGEQPDLTTGGGLSVAKYPYTNFQNLNLDWILTKLAEVEQMLRDADIDQVSAELAEIRSQIIDANKRSQMALDTTVDFDERIQTAEQAAANAEQTANSVDAKASAAVTTANSAAEAATTASENATAAILQASRAEADATSIMESVPAKIPDKSVTIDKLSDSARGALYKNISGNYTLTNDDNGRTLYCVGNGDVTINVTTSLLGDLTAGFTTNIIWGGANVSNVTIVCDNTVNSGNKDTANYAANRSWEMPNRLSICKLYRISPTLMLVNGDVNVVSAVNTSGIATASGIDRASLFAGIADKTVEDTTDLAEI